MNIFVLADSHEMCAAAHADQQAVSESIEVLEWFGIH